MALAELGHRVFFDVDRVDGLKAGKFQEQLEAVLVEAPVLLVLVTPAPSGMPGDWREFLSSMATIAECEKKGQLDYCRVEIKAANSRGPGLRGSHGTPWHPVEDALDPLHIGKAP